MSELNLMLHCGAQSVTRNDVLNAETPAATDTHQPIPHIRLVNEVTSALSVLDYRVTGEAHGLTHDGSRYFGVLQLETRTVDHALVVGVRNAHDKSFAASIAAGSGVFVCDNLAFSGSIKVSRKHTRYILRDLPRTTFRAASRLGQFFTEQERQFDSYKQTRITDERARSLMVESVKRGVFGCTHLPKVLSEWEQPSHDEFAEPTVWRLFNAVTEVAKKWGPDQTYRRTQLLHSLCDTAV